MTGDGVERVPSPGGACWMCGLPAVCGEKLPGRRCKVRALCQSHADSVFGLQDPPWQRLEAKIGAVNDVGTETIRLMSPLMPGEARDLQETQRAVNRLRSRETMIHAAVTQMLLGIPVVMAGKTTDMADLR